MAIQFVRPETIQIPLTDGAYIVIKKRLTVGEREDMMARLVNNWTPGEPMHVDSKVVRVGKVAAYLVGWSAPMPIGPDVADVDRLETIRNLDPESFDEIEKAIDAQLAADDAKKNNRTGPIASDPISASVAP